MVYEIMTNLVPFKGLSAYDIMRKVSEGDRPEFTVPIPDSYKNLIERCWAPNPEDRPTFSQIVELLKGDDFLTDDLDINDFDSYLSYIDKYHTEYQKSRKIINIKDFLKSQTKTFRSITVTKDGIAYDMTKSDVSTVIQENEKLHEYLSVFIDKKPDLELVKNSDFEERSTLGRGSTSVFKEVFRKERYAKKELDRLDSSALQDLLNEAKILFKLRHPCILQVMGIDHGDDNNHPSIYLSYAPYSLQTLIQRQEVDAFEKIRIIVEIILGMRYVHSKNVIHHTLSPSNILLTDEKHVQISDFFYAIDKEQGQNRTQLFSLIMAPEIAELGESEEEDITYTNKVDVFSFAIVLFFIVTNSMPKIKKFDIIMGKPLPIPSSVVSWVASLIKQCYSADPDARPSFNDILTILRSHDFDVFDIGQKLPSQQQKTKQLIERRIREIEAYEYVLTS